MKAAILAVGFLCLALPAGAEGPNCTLKVAMRLNMQTLADGRVTIPVKIDEHDYRFLVDTGGFISTVSSRIVTSEGYHAEHAAAQLRGMGSMRLDTFVTIKDFAMENSHGRNFQFFVDDFGALDWDGTLAPAILAAYDVDFDYAHEKLTLISPDHCPGKVVYWTNTPPAIVPMQMQQYTHIRVPVKLDGREIMATLDTGSHTSFMTLRAARYLGIEEKNPALKSLGNRSINGMVAPAYEYPFASMTFGDDENGGVTVNHPHVTIVSNKVWSETDLLLGEGILRQLHMYIAYKEKKLYLTPALAAPTEGGGR